MHFFTGDVGESGIGA